MTARQTAESDVLNEIQRKITVAKEEFADLQQKIRKEKEEAERKHLERIMEMKAELVNIEQQANVSLQKERDDISIKVKGTIRE